MSNAREATPSLLIGGAWRGGAQTMPVENPYTGEILAHVACATADDAAEAVEAAVRGQEALGRLTTGERANVLRGAAEAVGRHANTLAALITRETGKPLKASSKEVRRAANTLRLSAEEAVRLNGETIAFDSFPGGEQRHGYYVYEPAGVVAAITPFNDPLNLACHKLGPALAAGNAVVLKPADQAPLTAMRLAQILLAAGLPPDALQLLTGRGAEFGDALVSAPDVAMVSFTGGARTGERIARNAGLKRLSMELGANAPVIVCADADLDRAAAGCVAGAFWAAGQNCIGVQRIFVHRSVHATLRRGITDCAKALSVGDPMSPQTDVGPMINEREAERLQAWTEEAVAGGAYLACGGRRQRAVFHPTVLDEPPVDARVVTTEAFGPVVSLFPFDDLDDAITRANAAEHAIHAAIFTASLRDAHHAARSLRGAGVMVNDSTDYRLDAMPFGGAGRGNMGREGVRFAIREMSQTKVVCFHEG